MGRRLLQQLALLPWEMFAPTNGSAAPVRQLNYVLAANNASLAWQIQRLGAEEGSTPCLIYVDGNVTLSKPVPVPDQGISVARPMALVGLAGWNTSVDWHMQVREKPPPNHTLKSTSHIPPPTPPRAHLHPHPPDQSAPLCATPLPPHPPTHWGWE
jgi:hypothetical protein